MLLSVKKKKKKIYLSFPGKVFNLDKRDKIYNNKCVLVFLIKMRLGISNKKIESLFNCAHIEPYYWHATALLEDFKEKFLINTQEKLNKLDKYGIIRKLMKVRKHQNIVAADGVRFKVQKCRAEHSTQKKTYDVKHSFNGVGFIGINVIDKGYYCGFYPEKGTSTDGAHWDGRVIDYLILNNVDWILQLIKINSQPFEEDGTLVIMDRALGNGAHMLLHGIIWYKFPCCKKLKILAVQEANRSRLDATLYRWINECSFGKLKKYWAYFRNDIHYKLVLITGKWLNIVASIMNYFEIGLVEMNEVRLRYLSFMELRLNQEMYAPHEANPYYKLLLNHRYDTSLTEMINGQTVHKWIYCKNIQQLCQVSPYWNKEKLLNLFNCTNEELQLIGAGTFTIKQGFSYMIHAVNTMGIYVSTYQKYQKLIMIRNIKRKNSGKFGTKTITDNLKENANPTMHHVILTERPPDTYIRDDVAQYPERAKKLFWCCNCIAGSKTVNADSHVMCALLFLKYKIIGKKIPTHLTVEKYWDGIVHVHQLQLLLNDMTYGQRTKVLQLWLNRNVNK